MVQIRLMQVPLIAVTSNETVVIVVEMVGKIVVEESPQQGHH